MKTLFTAVTVIVATFVLQAQTIDLENSTILWKGEKVTGSHTGSISLASAEITATDKKITKGVFVVDMQSITCDDITDQTTNQQLVGHLKSDDFFGTAKYKTATLKITKASEFENGIAQVSADLTIKGITNPIEFEVEKKGSYYKAHLEVDRSLYKIKYGSGSFFDDLGDNLIYDIFKLDISLRIIK